MSLIYFFWCKLFGIVGGAILLTILLAQIVYACYNWIDDEDMKLFPGLEKAMIYLGSRDYYNPGRFWVFFLGTMWFTFVGIMIWPIVVPSLFVYGCLYSVRYFRRFQKKIKAALSKKSDIDHIHKKT